MPTSRADRLLAGAALVPALVLLAGGWRGAVVYLALLGALALIGWRILPSQHRREIAWLSIAALWLRVGVALGVHWAATQSSTPLFLDEAAYEETAWKLAKWWTHVGPPPDAYDAIYLVPHVYLNAVLYTLFGHDELVPRVAHAFIGALVPVAFFSLTRSWFDVQTARIAAWASAVDPSLVFWSSGMFKDIPVVLLLIVLLAGLQSVLRGVTPGRLAVLVVAYVTLAITRGPVAIYVGMLLPLGVTARWRGWTTSGTLAALLLLAVAGVLWTTENGYLGTYYLKPALSFRIWHYRENSATYSARTSLAEGLNPESPLSDFYDPNRAVGVHAAVPGAAGAAAAAGASTSAPAALRPRATDQEAALEPIQTLEQPEDPKPAWAVLESLKRNLAFLPVGVVHLLGAPFPWAVETTKDRLALLAQPYWYAMLALSVAGMLATWRRRPGVLLLPVAIGLTTVLYLSVTDSNVGNLIRHRVMLLPLVTPFAASGAVALLGTRLRAMGGTKPVLLPAGWWRAR